MKRIIFALLLFPMLLLAQGNDSVFIRKIYDEALVNGESYENLRSLCKDIGARVTGSAEAEMAVQWGYKLLNSYGFDSVYLQEIMVPHWERGNKESAWAEMSDGSLKKLNITALGMSVGSNGLISGEVIYFDSLSHLEKSEEDLTGKIVFLNQPMDAREISTFKAYGGCWPLRGNGTQLAADRGAIACVIRSLASNDDDFPHTGTLRYKEGGKKIPGLALSTNDANWLKNELAAGKVVIKLETDCRNYPDVKSYNVIAEMHGVDKNKVITVGGHLDSWDIGEGAHDDGAGIVHSIEALRLLKTVGYKPKHTIRCVLFMNEENGNQGGENYATYVKDRGEEHIFALESDAGGFSPQGFTVKDNPELVAKLQTYLPLLRPYDLFFIDPGYGGVDINPLGGAFENIALLGLRPDSQRYFDVHHSANDVFETVSKRELELGCAAVATMLYILDNI